MGNDNEARRDVIISRLPNRSAAKKQLRVQLARNLFPVSCRASEASRGKIAIINDRQRAWMAARLLAALAVIVEERGRGCVIHTSAAPHQSHTYTHTQKRPGSAPSRSENSSWGKAKQKPQTIHYPTATFPPANSCLWKSEEHYKKRKAVKVRHRAKTAAGHFPS